MSSEVEVEVKVYHERQRLQLCLLHALNNLFQHKDAFTRPELDAVARQLHASSSSSASPSMLSHIITPHHNGLTGNYDVNVLMAALDIKTKSLLWHDRRSPASSIDLSASHLFGVLLNSAVPRFRGFWTSRHWLALKNIQGVWYNLNSDLSAPYPFPDQQALVSFLNDAVARGAEIFLVYNQTEPEPEPAAPPSSQ